MNLSLYSRALFFFLSILIISCTKIATTDIGSDLIPPADGVITKDTVLEVKTKNAGYDTAYVGISDDHMLGYVNDALFGKTTASVNFQVAPPSAPFSWGIPKNNIVLDSVVLCIKYNGIWGDTLDPIKLHVYTIDPEVVFDDDSAYNTARTFQKGKEISEFASGTTVYPYLLDDVDTTKGFYTEVATNQIRIRLNNAFGQQLIDYDSATVYKNDTTFYSYLRGLIVEPEQSSGHALLQVSLTDTSTRLAVYYHSVDGIDTATRRFTPNVSSSASSNTIIRNYKDTEIPSYITNGSTSDDKVFMQTSPGTYATIDISALDTMRNVIVHRAEVLMYQIPDGDKFLTPPNLFLSAYNDSGAFAIPYDVNIFNGAVSNLSQFGVAPRLKDDNYYYSFDISRYVQGIVTRNEKRYNLVLTAPYNQYVYTNENFIYAVPISSPSLNKVATGRILLGGGNNSQYKMRLHIVYSLP